LPTPCQNFGVFIFILKMYDKRPLVSVIAICYNHEKYINECLQSVVNQTYSNVELIIIDDLSQDDSREKILEFHHNNPSCQYIFNEKNMGNCVSFNQALKLSKGKYIIDLSTDDVLLPNRIAEQVKIFEEYEQIGVVCSDADFIDENSNYLGNIKSKLKLPIGNVYADILAAKSFIMPVSVMMKRSIIEKLNGYDEMLTYEDFDFWVRSSRICEYGYVPKVLSYQRILKGSHSTKFLIKNSPLVQSSVKVCQKAFLLNETESENKALAIRLRFQLFRCVFTENFEAGKDILLLLDKTKGHNWKTFIGKILIYLKLPLNPLFINVMNLRSYLRFKI
jgi:glycosyltransferase involved in cell wall biosynthesis